MRPDNATQELPAENSPTSEDSLSALILLGYNIQKTCSSQGYNPE